MVSQHWVVQLSPLVFQNVLINQGSQPEDFAPSGDIPNCGLWLREASALAAPQNDLGSELA